MEGNGLFFHLIFNKNASLILTKFRKSDFVLPFTTAAQIIFGVGLLKEVGGSFFFSLFSVRCHTRAEEEGAGKEGALGT